jgi:hypothetical protein
MPSRSRSTSIVGLFCLSALLPAGPLPASERPQSDHLGAVVVGIDDYTSVAAGAGVPDRGWSNLEGAVNDADMFQQLLLDRLNFRTGNIKLLLNQEASRAAILAALDESLAAAKPGDVRVFYFAGHGSRVKNSKSTETDQKDESLVPADARAGAADIRDKELGRRFAAAAGRGVVLTVILDSCHSGSGARGLQRGQARLLADNPRDVADPTKPPNPSSQGALILSAAQDYQRAYETTDDQGAPHGSFSLALVRALRSSPRDEAIERVFRRVQGVMKAEGNEQDPVLEGLVPRRTATLLGGQAHTISERPVFSIERAPAADQIHLLAGSADGLAAGCELVSAARSNDKPIRLRVVEILGLARARAEMLAGDLAGIHAGDLFELDRWASGNSPAVSVWVPPALTPAADQEGAVTMSALGASRIAVSDDLAENPPTDVLIWSGETWRLEHAGGRVPLGPHLDVAAVRAALGQGAKTSKTIVALLRPPPLAVSRLLGLGPKSQHPAIRIETERKKAQYALVSRLRNGQAEASWILLTETSGRPLHPSDLPLRSDWVPLGDPAAAAQRLTMLAAGLGRLRGWLTLTPPASMAIDPFPYQLVLRRGGQENLPDSASTTAGDKIEALLRAQSHGAAANARPRYVYLFTIDAHGKSQLLFPIGEVENRVPADPDQRGKDVNLASFTVGEPFGTDHFYLLTSAEKLADPYVLQFDGVQLGEKRSMTSPLEQLFGQVNGLRRGTNQQPVPTSWSVERHALSSGPRRDDVRKKALAAPSPATHKVKAALTAP